jgi:hypothetical protein
MSYIGINPKKNISRFIETKPESAYPQSVKNEIKLLSFSKNGFAVPFGSYIYKIQKYPGDIDLVEEFKECCDVHDVVSKFERALKRIVKKIKKARYHYYSEFKAGLDKRFDFDIGNISNGIYTPLEYLQDIIFDLYDNKLLSKNEYDIIMDILSKGYQLSGDDYDIIFHIIRQHRILRWSEEEILRGYKLLPGKIKITLKTALAMHTPVKIDEVVFINGRFIEATNFIQLAYEEGDNYVPINIDLEKEHDAETQLPQEIEKLYYSNMWYSPFKMIKRMYSLSRHRLDQNTLLKILPFISSNTSLMYQIKSEIDIIILLLEKIKSPPMKSIEKQLDEMKGRIVSVIELDEDEDNSINDYIDATNKTKIKIKKIEILKALNKFIKKIINYETIEYLIKIGFNPPPRNLLPNYLKYANIVRNPDDNPRNPLDNKISGSGAIFQTAANIYRKLFCKGKARPLKDGEYHLGCHNYTGPGTRIDLPEVRNYQPYNDIDACSRQHDIDYTDAHGNPNLIREADKRVIQCYDKYPKESGYNAAKLGINSKMKLENALPILMKSIAPSYFGSGCKICAGACDECDGGCDTCPYGKTKKAAINEWLQKNYGKQLNSDKIIEI